MALLGAAAALGSSCTWAYASTRYAKASRDVGSQRVNLARASVVLPIYLVFTLALHGRNLFSGVSAAQSGWLLASVICSYALADSLFFTAARRIGITTALSIASAYPLWAALVGVIFGGERFGPLRAAGTLLCVGGVIALVRLAPDAQSGGVARARIDRAGLALAFVTSILWAGNSISIKEGAVGLEVMQVNAIRYAFALALLAAQVALLKRKRSPERFRPWPPGGWRPLVPAILADALFGSIFYVYGLSHTDLAVGATLSSLAPLLVVPVAIAMGEERWSPARFGAVLATVLGIALLVVTVG
jgi:drug/metabolite transporter (DMT)-like permease